MFDKNSPEYISNGVYEIAGIKFSTLWAYKSTRKYFASVNTTSINAEQSNQLTRMGYPSVLVKPDIGSYDKIKAFPIQSIEFYLDQVVTNTK
ncbi:hypothetical protein ATY36_19385 [Vibrio cidicii]|uniref:hypothetical protein n=1 Tax=Vibrio cidicii TaxID=1763883 RepID=UPI00078007F5|nr:hypothetical protein ATY36_19385 [Vibrio cidicii]